MSTLTTLVSSKKGWVCNHFWELIDWHYNGVRDRWQLTWNCARTSIAESYRSKSTNFIATIVFFRTSLCNFQECYLMPCFFLQTWTLWSMHIMSRGYAKHVELNGRRLCLPPNRSQHFLDSRMSTSFVIIIFCILTPQRNTQVKRSTICVLGAAWSIQGFMRHLHPEVEIRINVFCAEHEGVLLGDHFRPTRLRLHRINGYEWSRVIESSSPRVSAREHDALLNCVSGKSSSRYYGTRRTLTSISLNCDHFSLSTLSVPLAD